MPDTLDLTKFGQGGSASDKLDLSRFPGVSPAPIVAPAAAPPPKAAAGPQEPDFLDRLGMAGGLSGLFKTAKDIFTGEPGAREGFVAGAAPAAKAVAPTAVRMGSGVLGAEGGPLGALIAGGGETIAEMIEKGTVDPRELEKARIAVAAGTGMIPFGRVVQGGRVATSALRGGALAGGGETAREALAGESFNPAAVGMTTAMGAAGAGGASKLGTMFGVSPKLASAEEAAAAPPRVSSGQQANALRRQVNTGAGEKLPSGAREFDLGDVASPGIGVESRPPAPVGPGAPIVGTPAEASGRVQRIIAKEEAAAAKEAAAAEKAAAKAAADARIEDAITEGGLEPGAPSIGENAAGQKSMRIPYKAPKAATPPTPAVRDLTPAEYAAANAPEAAAPAQSPLAQTLGVEPPPTAAPPVTGDIPDPKGQRWWDAEGEGPAGMEQGFWMEPGPPNAAGFSSHGASPVQRPVMGPEPAPTSTDLVNQATAAEAAKPENVARIQALRDDAARMFEESKARAAATPPATDWKEDLLGAEGPAKPFDWPEAGGRFEADATGSHVTVPPAAAAPAAEESPLAQLLTPKARRAPKPPGVSIGGGSTPGFAEPPVGPLPPPTRAAEPIAAAAPEAAPELAKFFKTKAGAAGANYKGAKLAEKAGEIGSADEAYNAFARERAALGQETAPRTPPQPAAPAVEAPPVAGGPDVAAGTTGPTGDWVADQSTLAETALQDPTLRQRLLDLAKGERGSATLPNLSSSGAKRLLGGGIGAAVGAPIGSKVYGEDDDYGALKGALAGGLIGANATGGMNNLVNYRNSMLLASPGPTSKNIIGDIGGMSFEALKQALTPGQGGYAKDLFRNLPFVKPGAYLRDFKEALLHPNPGEPASSMRDIAGEALDKPMDLIYRPFNASNYAIKEAMSRAGAPHKAIEQATGISTPETKAMQSWLGMQKHPAFRYLFPFQKIASNIAEGARNIPGVSLMAGNPADKWQRTAVGGLQMALGAGSELYDEANAAEGEPTGNWTKGIRAAAMGPKGVAPYAAGQGLTALLKEGPAKALSELVNLVPGARATLPAPFPNESADDYAYRVLSGPISQMVPSALKPDPGSVR